VSEPAIEAAIRSAKASHAVTRRHHPDQPELADESLRRLRALTAEGYLRKLLGSDPPLDLSQRRHLADILLGRR
jgi:hypothetical protein